ncbi:MAG: glycoside hydrolase family 28 protein, partial [Bacteroidota bacterium]|nr:glycoside hydrolase family 28 protein [Bacteroidota bacterium]
MNKELNSILILFIFFSTLSKAQNYNIKDFGALAGTNVINTVAINKAILKCSNDGGGRVIIPAGEFITGTLHLKSDVNLHLERGA